MRHRAKDVIEAVADAFGVTVADLKGRSRLRRIVVPRQIACALMRDQCGMSYPTIGIMLNRDHTTVMHALRRFPDHDAEFGPLIDNARGRLHGGVFRSIQRARA